MRNPNIKKKRVCFWLPETIHEHLKALESEGKTTSGKRYSIGDVITELCIANKPDLLNTYKNV